MVHHCKQTTENFELLFMNERERERDEQEIEQITIFLLFYFMREHMKHETFILCIQISPNLSWLKYLLPYVCFSFPQVIALDLPITISVDLYVFSVKSFY